MTECEEEDVWLLVLVDVSSRVGLMLCVPDRDRVKERIPDVE